jgi:hypothetical protein
MTVQRYDLVGDIHGHADALHRLLHELDYSEVEGLFRHPLRKMIFIGDFIDRGPSTDGFSHFVSSTTAPVASGWSGCRVGLAPTGKRCLVTAHTLGGHLRWGC